ncbi:hypothetical protein GOEFS_115_00280 [Gordonia effusa NBRC 100432]|uniref:Uncharacterized protein n=1 Tax=Gordonia effusa NBRC 100432 TaxID=1077974 RepID=H0R5N7_9ACTN|nr:hypothetical protein [Gordonia effusa]GAB20388.1 hypothetical protein GOEFS_115_00280 [Gordonia effusa NBRC 100432]
MSEDWPALVWLAHRARSLAEAVVGHLDLSPQMLAVAAGAHPEAPRHYDTAIDAGPRASGI